MGREASASHRSMLGDSSDSGNSTTFLAAADDSVILRIVPSELNYWGVKTPTQRRVGDGYSEQAIFVIIVDPRPGDHLCQVCGVRLTRVR